MKIFFTVLFTFLLSSLCAQNKPVHIGVDFNQENGNLNPAWQWFGYDEPNYTYMKDGKKLLSELIALSSTPVYIRTHNLLTTGEGTYGRKWGSTNAYTEDKNGNPIYNWKIVDSIVDVFVNNGMKPLMEIGFMPEALSRKPNPYRHSWATEGELWTGWAYPPNDYKKWNALVYEWVRHSVERYGEEEVKTWFWEVWNEPNIGYWQGTFKEFCKLYDYTVDAVKRACPDCKFGGPHTTNPDSEKAQKYLVDFLEHCISGKNYVTGQKGSPIDFIAFHAKGNPELVDDHIRMNMAPQLKAIDNGFRIVRSFEKYKDLPVIIGECDPEGCAACSIQKHPQYGYRNGTMYPTYTVASHARIYDLAVKHQVNLKGILTWGFEFEEQRWFDGFRDLATNGVDKPILNVYRMFGLMPTKRLHVENKGAISVDEIMENSIRGDKDDIHALASKDENSMTVLIWNYHDDDVQGESSNIELALKNIPAERVKQLHYRVDSNYSNAYEVWKKMGSPQNVSNDEFKELEKAGQLQLFEPSTVLKIDGGQTTINFLLPRQGVSLVKLTW